MGPPKTSARRRDTPSSSLGADVVFSPLHGPQTHRAIGHIPYRARPGDNAKIDDAS